MTWASLAVVTSSTWCAVFHILPELSWIYACSCHTTDKSCGCFNRQDGRAVYDWFQRMKVCLSVFLYERPQDICSSPSFSGWGLGFQGDYFIVRDTAERQCGNNAHDKRTLTRTSHLTLDNSVTWSFVSNKMELIILWGFPMFLKTKQRKKGCERAFWKLQLH